MIWTEFECKTPLIAKTPERASAILVVFSVRRYPRLFNRGTDDKLFPVRRNRQVSERHRRALLLRSTPGSEWQEALVLSTLR